MDKDMTRKRTVLLIDDEPEVLESIVMVFRTTGYIIHTAESGKEALELFKEQHIDLVICDNALPDVQGLELIKQFREIDSNIQMIMVTGQGTIDLAVSAMKAGAFDFVTKPFDPEHLLQLSKRAFEMYDALMESRMLKERIDQIEIDKSDSEIIGKHPSLRNIIRLIDTVAPTDSTVLIEGESGTGKELVARMIHKRSKRVHEAFVAVDCGAIPEGLVESELFGHEKGAFTGAAGMKLGKFERADKGSLFMDEITNLPIASQGKLLRALQEMVIERVGGTKGIPVNIRLIAATNIPLQKAVKEGKFREDLYYRLNIIKIRIPPLRERKSDILPLTIHFIRKHKDRIGKQTVGLTRDALSKLVNYSWPGNVRELENAIEHALIMTKTKDIQSQDLPDFELYESEMKQPEPTIESFTQMITGMSNNEFGNKSILEETEKNMILKAIKDSSGNKYLAAKILGIPRSSLYSKLKKFGLTTK